MTHAVHTDDNDDDDDDDNDGDDDDDGDDDQDDDEQTQGIASRRRKLATDLVLAPGTLGAPITPDYY